jgi:hypothetical protein
MPTNFTTTTITTTTATTITQYLSICVKMNN